MYICTVTKRNNMDITSKISEIVSQLDEQYRACEMGTSERFKAITVWLIMDYISDKLSLGNMLERMPDAVYYEFRGRKNSELDEYTRQMANEIALTISTLLASACENTKK